MKKTLGLTGLTMNAMALIAPGAFLWLTFAGQSAAGATGPSMWIGILFATVLCLATAVCYAEMAKLYPGTGSSYYFAEQSFINHDSAWPYARLAKFIVGWGSHLYYWIYPGVMVGVIGVISGYLVGTIWPSVMSASNPGPMFMMAVAIVFSFGVAYIAHRGVNGSTSVNIAINIIQISALLLFSVVALNYRMSHPEGSPSRQFDAQTSASYSYEYATTSQMVGGVATDVVTRDANGVPQPKLDASGKPVPFHISYPEKDSSGAFVSHPNATSVIRMHNFGWMFVQATIAILILVGFESVTSMGGEAKNAKRDVPIAVITSLLVQGCFCYLFEYFAANYVLNNGYTMGNAAGSAAPIGDLMILVGDTLFGAGNGRIFMLAEAATVFLALIGTTLSCMNTGARVTYAMGKDKELPDSMGLLHKENCDPASRHLDAGRDFSSRRVHHGCGVFRRRGGSARCRDPGSAARLLVELRIYHSRQNGGSAEFLPDHDPGLELRHVPSLHAELRDLHHLLPQASAIQVRAPSADSGFWAPGEPGVHGVLSCRPVHGLWHKDGASARAGDCLLLGHLRRNLFPAVQQSRGSNHARREPCVGRLRAAVR